MKSVRPLDRFQVIRTQNVEEIRAAFARMYGQSMSVEGNAKRLDAAINRCAMKDISLSYARFGADMGLVFPETVVTFHMIPVRGRGEATVNGAAIPLSAGHGVTISQGVSFAERFNTDYEHVVLAINTLALTDKLAVLTGAPINRPLTFYSTKGEASFGVKAFRDHFFFLVDKLSASAVPLPRLLSAEFEQTLIVMFLHANRHNCSHLLERAPVDASPWQIRRAEEYIEANWRQAITLEKLAAVTEMSAFDLFRSFKSSRGYSPTEFADRVRLRHTRELLRRADATTTVAAVASACGFSDLWRFTRDYVRVFGEHPSQTLRSASSGLFDGS
jgi:AraC-like DNA-binding protein